MILERPEKRKDEKHCKGELPKETNNALVKSVFSLSV